MRASLWDRLKTPLKIIGVIVGIVVLMIMVLLLFFPAKNPTYEPGYIFYDYKNDTNYINPNAPFVNVGGRIYYIFKEELNVGILEDYCNHIAYINYDTGTAHTVCPYDRCIHHRVDYRILCELVFFVSDMRIDQDGWIYGIYRYKDYQNPGQVSTKPDTVARYNLYSFRYEEIYTYQEQRHTEGYYQSKEISHVTAYGDYVFFYERLEASGSDTIKSRTFLRRFQISTHELKTMAEVKSFPDELQIWNDRIYILRDDSGLFCYDLDLKNKEIMIDFSLEKYANMRISMLQYESYSKTIYFLSEPRELFGKEAEGKTLCTISAYDPKSESPWQDRILRQSNWTGLAWYQLTDGMIYLTRYQPRYIGDIVTADGSLVPYYDETDGKIYALEYMQMSDEGTEFPTPIYDASDQLLRNYTVIGHYMYCEEWALAETENHGEYRETDYCVRHQIRVNLVTGDQNVLLPRD